VQAHCPHCRNAIELVDEQTTGILCPACGNSFRPDDERTPPYPGDQVNAPQKTVTYTVAPESVGAVISGKYKLLQEIGEGGMGTVFMTDQTHPVKRRVAVKVIKAGMDSARVLARFEAERQALALMDHPNIAKVFDAGTTDTGRLFFVMELVKGIPLTQFCDEHKLAVVDRLKLFTQVCSVVQHAHQKGIIHRDLKPTNILVESHDGQPGSKAIDFGLAKATSGLKLTERTLFTALGQVAGTPLYMAPEQAAFNAIDVDTRADIYSLGVILYELLTGTTPIERETAKKAAFDELLKLIREKEPPMPSSRISSSESKASIAALRQMEAVKLGSFVRGELDWIVMKALSKERDRRYETASAFAKDIELFLNCEPVTAGPPSAAYRLRKFVRRNRPKLIAVAVLLFAMVAGVAGTIRGLIRAASANKRAEVAGAIQLTSPTLVHARRLQITDMQTNGAKFLGWRVYLPTQGKYRLMIAVDYEPTGQWPERAGLLLPTDLDRVNASLPNWTKDTCCQIEG
jgi:serine/threonine protein kinase